MAFAQDGAAVPSVPGGSAPGLDYLLFLGPYGALEWEAYLLGKGVKVTVQIELSERDRELLAMVGARDGARSALVSPSERAGTASCLAVRFRIHDTTT